MRKTVSWFEISKWPSHWQLSATCLPMLRPAILFVLQCFFALSKLNSHSQETSKNQVHSTQSANYMHNGIDLELEPFLKLLSEAMVCCARCRLVSVYNCKQNFWLVSGCACLLAEEAIVGKVGSTIPGMKYKMKQHIPLWGNWSELYKTSVILYIAKGLCWLEKPCGVDPAGKADSPLRLTKYICAEIEL